METILIAGATRLLGSSLVPYITDSGHKIVTNGFPVTFRPTIER